MTAARQDADVIRQALITKRNEHHKNCATRSDDGCDCYARNNIPAHQALDRLAALLRALERENEVGQRWGRREQAAGDALAERLRASEARVHTLEQALGQAVELVEFLAKVCRIPREVHDFEEWHDERTVRLCLTCRVNEFLARAVVLEGAAGQLTTTDASDTTSEQSVGAPASQARGTEQETQRRREIDWTNQPGESPT